MSINTRAIATFIFIVTIGIANTTAEDFSEAIDSRGPASVPDNKKSEFIKPSLFKHTEKIRGPLKVTLQMPSQLPDKVGDVFVVTATIRSSENLRSIDFKWNFPPEVEVVNGEKLGRIDSLLANQPKEVSITLKSLTGANHKVHFLAAASEQGTRFADSAQYNTLFQTVLNESKKTLSKAVEEASRENRPGFKVFH